MNVQPVRPPSDTELLSTLFDLGREVTSVLELEELLPHLHSVPERPDWIPYRTSYYQERWGFCIAHRVLEGLGLKVFALGDKP